MSYQAPQYPMPPTAETPPRRRKKWPWIVGGLVVLLVVVIASANSNNGAITQASGGGGNRATTAAASPHTATWGQRYTWPDGLAVEVSKPAAFTPSQGAIVLSGSIVRPVAFTVTVVNGTSSPYSFNAALMSNSAQFGGADASAITDLDTNVGTAATATVLPGHSYSYKVAYSVAKQAGTMQLDFTESIGGDPAIFAGQA